MPLYWLIEQHVYKRLVLPWQQLITNLTRANSANENAWSSVSWLRFDLTWRTLVKRKLEFNLLPSWYSVDGRVDLVLEKHALRLMAIEDFCCRLDAQLCCATQVPPCSHATCCCCCCCFCCYCCCHTIIPLLLLLLLLSMESYFSY